MLSVTISDAVAKSMPPAAAKLSTTGNVSIALSASYPASAMKFSASLASVALNCVDFPASFAAFFSFSNVSLPLLISSADIPIVAAT